MDPFAVVGEQLTELLPQRTAPAPARAVLGVLAASWAGMPETGWPGAGSTQRFGQGPAAYESNLAAAGAARPALLAGVTPRLPGDRGDLTGSRAPVGRVLALVKPRDGVRLCRNCVAKSRAQTLSLIH